jgi:hypothetical protein
MCLFSLSLSLNFHTSYLISHPDARKTRMPIHTHIRTCTHCGPHQASNKQTPHAHTHTHTHTHVHTRTRRPTHTLTISSPICVSSDVEPQENRRNQGSPHRAAVSETLLQQAHGLQGIRPSHKRVGVDVVGFGIFPIGCEVTRHYYFSLSLPLSLFLSFVSSFCPSIPSFHSALLILFSPTYLPPSPASLISPPLFIHPHPPQATSRIHHDTTPQTSSPESPPVSQVIAQLHHDAGAFTQGLEFLAGRFIESTGIASTLVRTPSRV